jgi:type IV pilus assembly protein PilP
MPTVCSSSRTLLLAALTLGVAACAPELPPPPKPSVSQTTAADTVAIADESQTAMYVYSPVGKRDPFRDPATIAKPRAATDTGVTKLTPLQMYEIDQLKLAFTNTATSSPVAMIVDPAGRGHMVTIGDFLGKNWGKVSAIYRDRLTITETMVDPNTNAVFPNYIEMPMPKNSNDKQDYELNILGSEVNAVNAATPR